MVMITSYCLLTAYHVPGTRLSRIHVCSYLTFITAPQGEAINAHVWRRQTIRHRGIQSQPLAEWRLKPGVSGATARLLPTKLYRPPWSWETVSSKRRGVHRRQNECKPGRKFPRGCLRGCREGGWRTETSSLYISVGTMPTIALGVIL